MSASREKLTAKGNTLLPEVWVTHWDTDSYKAYLNSVNDKPWDADYDAPITQYADNTRYVPGTVVDDMRADIHALLEQLSTIEHAQDDKLIRRLRNKYRNKRTKK